jgi:hypothetical protein
MALRTAGRIRKNEPLLTLGVAGILPIVNLCHREPPAADALCAIHHRKILSDYISTLSFGTRKIYALKSVFLWSKRSIRQGNGPVTRGCRVRIEHSKMG